MHAGGQRFDPAILHHLFKNKIIVIIKKNDKKLNISSNEFEFIFDFRIKMIFKNIMLKSLIFSFNYISYECN